MVRIPGGGALGVYVYDGDHKKLSFSLMPKYAFNEQHTVLLSLDVNRLETAVKYKGSDSATKYDPALTYSLGLGYKFNFLTYHNLRVMYVYNLAFDAQYKYINIFTGTPGVKKDTSKPYSSLSISYIFNF